MDDYRENARLSDLRIDDSIVKDFADQLKSFDAMSADEKAAWRKKMMEQNEANARSAESDPLFGSGRMEPLGASDD